MSSLEFSADPDRIDRELTHRWISQDSYWGQGRSAERQNTATDNSRPYGVYDTDSGTQVAFARVITDGAIFGWLLDVFVDPVRRGEGIGKMLMSGIMADIEPLQLRRFGLVTGDAHELYRQFGFSEVSEPQNLMARIATL